MFCFKLAKYLVKLLNYDGNQALKNIEAIKSKLVLDIGEISPGKNEYNTKQ